MATVCSAEVSSAELELIRHLPARRGRYRAFLDSLAASSPLPERLRAIRPGRRETVRKLRKELHLRFVAPASRRPNSTASQFGRRGRRRYKEFSDSLTRYTYQVTGHAAESA